MNPWPMIRADLKAMRWMAFGIVALVAVAVAAGIVIATAERGLRASSARAADDFPLLIGAPGSQTQLVLTTVYLQLEALPLMDGAVLRKVAVDPRAKDWAPIAYGDVVQGYPVVGTTTAFLTRWGRIAPVEGRAFAAEGEAVVGADVKLALGAKITPSHMVGAHRSLGVAAPDEHDHAHEHTAYEVVGRLPRLNSPWDRAILVPVESVWETHGLGNGHAEGNEAIGPPFEAETLPGLPAIVVKPASVPAAYAARQAYRQGGTTALFPAEVLVDLYVTMGDVRDVTVWIAALNALVVFGAVAALVFAVSAARRKRYAVLRALGAPRSYLLAVVWLGATALVGLGAVAGLGAGWAATALLAGTMEARTGLAIAVRPEWADVLFALALMAVGGAFALIPAYAAARAPVEEGLRS